MKYLIWNFVNKSEVNFFGLLWNLFKKNWGRGTFENHCKDCLLKQCYTRLAIKSFKLIILIVPDSFIYEFRFL